MTTEAKTRAVYAWAGYSDGKPHAFKDDGTYGSGMYGIFRSRKAARRCYEDVRHVKIIEVKP